MHSDGNIRALAEDIVEGGVDWIRSRFRGRTCIETVGCKEGGLMLIYGLYPGVPLENVKALMDAMTRYATLYR